MTDDHTSPPAEWYEAKECPRDGCEVEKFVPLSMDIHLARDHGDRDGDRDWIPLEEL